MGFRALKLLSEGFGGVKPCNHQYRGCHLKNPTDINVYVHNKFLFHLNHFGITPRPPGLTPGLTPGGVQARFTAGKLLLEGVHEAGTF